MKVFFTASLDGKKKYQDYYDHIISTLRSLGVEVISKEIQEYDTLLDLKSISGLSSEEIHYQFVKKGMNIANAVIIEASMSKFQLGHEATLALLYNKPVLCLSQTKDYSIQIKHPRFYARKYKSKNDLTNYIKDFTSELEGKYLTVRFNMFLKPEQKTFLEQYAHQKGTTASDVIRGLIDEKINDSNIEDELT